MALLPPPRSEKISSSPATATAAAAAPAAAAAAAVTVEEKSNRCLPLSPVAVARICCQLPPLPSAAAADTGEGKNTPPPSSTTTVVCCHCHPLLPPSPPSKKIQLSSAAVVHHYRRLPPLPSAAAVVTAVKEKSDRRTQPPSSVSTTAMWHPSKGVIHLDGDSSSNKSVGSDVEEVVMWDHSLHSSKTFQRAVLILSGHKFKSPSLDAQSQVLLLFLDKPSSDYFKSRSSQAIAFNKIQDACKSGWKTEASRKKKWSVRFVAEHLAFLLVLAQLKLSFS